MKTTNRLLTTIQKIKDSGRIALCGYFLVGYPSPKVFYEMVRTSEKLDVIEFGIPTGHPSLDGAIISDAHKVVVDLRGMDAETALALIGGLREIPQPRFVMTYTQEGRALDGFLRKCVEDEIDGIFAPDIGSDEATYVASIAHALHLVFVSFIDGLMPPADIVQKVEISDIIYLKASKGATGQIANLDEQFADELLTTIARVRQCKPDVMIAIGIGIQKPEQIQQLARLDIDMIIVGTKLMEYLNLGERALTEYIQSLYQATSRSTKQKIFT
jgi:tryptophan synthase alpha subunit